MNKIYFEYLWHIIRFFAFSLPVSFLNRTPGRHWAIIDLIKVAIEYEPMSAIPVVDLIDMYPSILEAPIISSKPGHASAKSSEIMALASLASSRKPKLIIEIGTQRGGTTLLLAQNAGFEARTVTLDILSPGEYPYTGSAFRGTQWEGLIRFFQHDSRTFDWSPYLGKADFIYVDGCHDYEYVLADTKTALSLRSPRGIILWHDFPSANGVRRCLMELSRSQKGFYHVRGTRLALFDPHKASLSVRPHWTLTGKDEA